MPAPVRDPRRRARTAHRHCLHWPHCAHRGAAAIDPGTWGHRADRDRIGWPFGLWTCRDHRASHDLIRAAAIAGLTRDEVIDLSDRGELTLAGVELLAAFKRH